MKRGLLLLCTCLIALGVVLGSFFLFNTISTKTTQSTPVQEASTQEALSLEEPDDNTESQQEIKASPLIEDADAIRQELNITNMFYSDFVHGEKNADVQKYIILHDTEGGGVPQNVVSGWESSGNHVAAHFVIGKDGLIVQTAPLDTILHHAGYGDTGHNISFGVEDESRDDKVGTQPIGSWAKDYGMNSYSVGIEMIHKGQTDPYPEAQLKALDELIHYIDVYYGFTSEIIDHKAWRTGNSDTSAAFATYLKNYQNTRTHDGK